MPFAALGLPAPLVKGVRAAGYTSPTPIQAKAIPLVLTGRDLIAAAQTGTGKTAAFILPILAHLLKGGQRLRALVLTPTRELAAQIETNARDYARFTDLSVGVVFGGVPIGPQERLLRNHGVDLLVATPGRLLDLQGRQSLSLDEVEILVLDEADRMVDMGFAPDLRRILKLLPDKRQTLLFSATMPPELNKVAKETLHDPNRVDLAPPSRPAAGITQAVYPVPKHLKTDLLHYLLGETDTGGVIVFTRTKHGAARLAKNLERRGHSVSALHGDRTQSQRERALSDLRRGRIDILVATDIASRGIDVKDITHIINFDVPHTPEDYVHRIGRTGRVDALGDAFTFMSPDESKDVTGIERFLGRTIPRVVMPDFDYKARAVATPGGSGRERDEERGGRGGGRGRGGFGGGGGGGRGGRSEGRNGGGRGVVAVVRHGAGPSSGSSSSSGSGGQRSAAPAAPSHGRRPKAADSTRRGKRRI